MSYNFGILMREYIYIFDSDVKSIFHFVLSSPSWNHLHKSTSLSGKISKYFWNWNTVSLLLITFKKQALLCLITGVCTFKHLAARKLISSNISLPYQCINLEFLATQNSRENNFFVSFRQKPTSFGSFHPQL